ncbi:unnamed protein product [Pedinophyceae sp. YPF-701]|nr:unnamed protein product [Pedinophyceae sp. YPF-701]
MSGDTHDGLIGADEALRAAGLPDAASQKEWADVCRTVARDDVPLMSGARTAGEPDSELVDAAAAPGGDAARDAGEPAFAFAGDDGEGHDALDTDVGPGLGGPGAPTVASIEALIRGLEAALGGGDAGAAEPQRAPAKTEPARDPMVAFHRLQPVCARLFEQACDARALAGTLEELEGLVRDTDREDMRAPGVADFLMWPLLMMMESASGAGGEAAAAGGAADADADGPAFPAAAASERVVERVLSCTCAALEQCPCATGEQLVELLGRAAPLAAAPSAGEEAVLGALECVRLALGGGPGAADDVEDDGDGAATAGAARSDGGADELAGRLAGMQLAESPVETLREPESAGHLGATLGNLLAVARRECERGARGSPAVRLAAVRAVRALVCAVADGDALAPFLPGLVSGLARCIVACVGQGGPPPEVGALAAARPLAETVLALSDSVVHATADATFLDGTARRAADAHFGESAPTGTGGVKTAEDAMQRLQAMVGRALAGDAASSRMDEDEADVSWPSRSAAARDGPPEDPADLRVDRDVAWVRGAAEKLSRLLPRLLPPLCMHPKPSVRAATAVAVSQMLTRCPLALAPCVATLLEASLELSRDPWARVSAPAVACLERVAIGEEPTTAARRGGDDGDGASVRRADRPRKSLSGRRGALDGEASAAPDLAVALLGGGSGAALGLEDGPIGVEPLEPLFGGAFEDADGLGKEDGGASDARGVEMDDTGRGVGAIDTETLVRYLDGDRSVDPFRLAWGGADGEEREAGELEAGEDAQGGLAPVRIPGRALERLLLDLMVDGPKALKAGSAECAAHMGRLAAAISVAGPERTCAVLIASSRGLPAVVDLACQAFAPDAGSAALLLHARGDTGAWTVLDGDAAAQAEPAPLLPRMSPGLQYITSKELYDAVALVMRCLGRCAAVGGATHPRGHAATTTSASAATKASLAILCETFLERLTAAIHTRAPGPGGAPWQASAAAAAMTLSEVMFGASAAWQPPDGILQRLRIASQQRTTTDRLVAMAERAVEAATAPAVLRLHTAQGDAHEQHAATFSELGLSAALLRACLELTGTLARALPTAFPARASLLATVLVPLLERAEDPAGAVAAAAEAALGSVCVHCGFGSLRRLLAANSDHVVREICQQLRHLDAHPRAPRLLASLLRRTGAAPDILPLLAEPAAAAFKGLSVWARRNQAAQVRPFLAVLAEMAKGAAEEGRILADDAERSRDEHASKAAARSHAEDAAMDGSAAPGTTQPVEVREYFLGRKRDRDAADPATDAAEGSGEYTPPLPGMSAALREEIAQRRTRATACASLCGQIVESASDLASSPDVTSAVTALSTCTAALHALAGAQRALAADAATVDALLPDPHPHRSDLLGTSARPPPELLPSVHAVWYPLATVLRGPTDGRAPVVEAALDALADVAVSTDGSFLARRVATDAWPAIRALLLYGSGLGSAGGPRTLTTGTALEEEGARRKGVAALVDPSLDMSAQGVVAPAASAAAVARAQQQLMGLRAAAAGGARAIEAPVETGALATTGAARVRCAAARCLATMARAPEGARRSGWSAATPSTPSCRSRARAAAPRRPRCARQRCRPRTRSPRWTRTPRGWC